MWWRCMRAGKPTCRKSMINKQTLKNLPRLPSSDSVVVSDIKNMMAKTVCFIETTMADMRFMLIMLARCRCRGHSNDQPQLGNAHGCVP